MGKLVKTHNILLFVTEDWYFKSHREALVDKLARGPYRFTVGTRFNNASYRASSALRYMSLPFRRSLKNPLVDIWCSVRMLMSVRKERPEIVHLIALKPILLSILAVLLFRKTMFIHAFAGLGYLFSSGDRSAKRLRFFVFWILKCTLRRKNSWVLVQNSDDRAFFLEHELISSERIISIPGSGMKMSEFPLVDETNYAVVSPTVILPARMIRDKGIYEFVAAAKLIAEHDPSIRFALVGGVDDDNPAGISKEQLESWSENSNVEWWGHRADMRQVYLDSHIVCLPSYREGLPKSLLEAGAFGLPLIASDVPGCRDICRHNRTGLLVPEKNVIALADAIMLLAHDHSLRRKLGQQARALVEKEFSIEVIADLTDNMYRDLLIVQENS